MQKEILKVIHPKRNFGKLVIWVCVACALIVIGVYYYTQKANTQKKVVYLTTSATLGDIAVQISATGTLYPLNEVQIGTQISGIISKLYVDTNDEVKKGQLLAKIDDSKILQQLQKTQAQLLSVQAQLQSLKANLKDKQWQYERLKKLHQESKGKFLSFSDIQNAQVAYEVALAELQSKQANLKELQTNIKSVQIDYENTKITSPIDGVVLVRSVDVGQTVAASFSAPELFRVAQNLEEMKLVVKIAESDIGKIRVGQKVHFSVDAYPQRTFEAQVDKINYGSTITENIVSYEVSINVKNPQLLLRPGMSATAQIQVAEAKNALLLPVSALYFNPTPTASAEKSKSLFGTMRKKKVPTSAKQKNQEIWIVKNRQIQKQKVEIGIQNGEFFEVKNLPKGTKVVIGMEEK